MRVVHLKEALLNPRRIVLAVWDVQAGRFAEKGEWIVHFSEKENIMAERLRDTLTFFASRNCSCVSGDVWQVLGKYRVPLPAGWTIFKGGR